MLAYLSVFAAVALGIGLACFLRKSAPRLVIWCAFIVGCGLAGWMGAATRQTINSTIASVDNIGRATLGLGIGVAVAVFLVIWFFHDVRKKGKVSKLGPLIGLILPFTLPLLAVALASMPATHPAGVQLNQWISGTRLG